MFNLDQHPILFLTPRYEWNVCHQIFSSAERERIQAMLHTLAYPL